MSCGVSQTVSDLTHHTAAPHCSRPSSEHLKKAPALLLLFTVYRRVSSSPYARCSRLGNRPNLMSPWPFTESFWTDSLLLSHNPHSLTRLYDLHLYWREECDDWCSGWLQRPKPGHSQIKWHIGSSGCLLVSTSELKPDNFFLSHIVLMKSQRSSWRFRSIMMTDQWQLGENTNMRSAGTLLESCALITAKSVSFTELRIKNF